MKIALAADHAGFTQSAQLKDYLTSLGYECIDFGPTRLAPKDDYPDFVRLAAKAVASGQCDKGIVIGGDGQGEAMVANRVKGVRCAVYYGPVAPRGIVDISGRVSHDPYEIIRLSRLHNNANMLSFGCRFVSLVDMKNAAKLFLETGFSDEARHSRRIAKIDEAS